MAIYTARSVMHWTLEEFWQATPASLSAQIDRHLQMRRAGSRKKGKQPIEPKKVKYVDQLPGHFW